ncbi:MAG TPA: hypothetical protein DEA08_23950 [Planctomycetes bacterium]|nr:hypothetical protein [Planctomycetota bacterium]
MTRAGPILVALLVALLGAPALSLAAEPPQLEEGVSAEAYAKTGRAVLAGLNPLKKAFKQGHAERGLHPSVPAGESGPPELRWQPRAINLGALRVEEVTALPDAETRREIAGLLAQLAAPLEHVDDVELKVDLLERLEADGTATVRLRFVLYGPTAAGPAVMRSSLRSRWRPTSAAREAWAPVSLGLRWARLVVGPGNLFREVARERGLRHYGSPDPRFLPPSSALRYQVIRHAIGGASAADVNGDGRDDLLLTKGEGLALFLNLPEGFREVTRQWGLADVEHPNVALATDFDGDGDADLFVGQFYGRNRLFENRGGRFVDVTEGSGLAQDDMTAVALAADFDGDGAVDLYLGRFLDARSEVPDTMLYTRNGAPNKLYLARGPLRFRDVSAASGADDRGLTLGAAAGDIDGDGDVDIYLANDFGRNVLLRNTGRGRFKDATLETDTLAVSAGMSASLGDMDNDGLLDLYVSSIRSNQRWFSEDVNIRAYVLRIVRSGRRERLQQLFWDLRRHMGEDWARVGWASLKGNYLLRQRPDGGFADTSEEANADPPGWFWSSGFFDADNDGLLDVLTVNGWITGELKDDL